MTTVSVFIDSVRLPLVTNIQCEGPSEEGLTRLAAG